MKDFTAYILFFSLCVFCGCRNGADKVELLDRRASIEDIKVSDGFVSTTFEAAGGYVSWLKQTRFDIECIVKVNKPGDGFYLTEYDCQLYPWSNSIVVSASEPGGAVQARLVDGRYAETNRAGLAELISAELNGRYLLGMILNLYTAPARLVEGDAVHAAASGPGEIKGLWHRPLLETSSRSAVVIEGDCRLFYYQDQDTSLIDMIWFTDLEDEFFMVRGYDYRKLSGSDILIPAAAEIYITDDRGVIQRQLMRLEVK